MWLYFSAFFYQHLTGHAYRILFQLQSSDIFKHVCGQTTHISNHIKHKVTSFLSRSIVKMFILCYNSFVRDHIFNELYISGLFVAIMAPITIYNILIIIVYATLFWYLYKEEQNTKVIELNRPAGIEEVKFS